MRRSFRKLLGNVPQVDAVALLKPGLTDLVLLDVVVPTEAYGPSIRWLERDPAIRLAPDMRAFNRPQKTAGYTAMMFAYPGAVSRALSAIRLAGSLALKPVR